MPPGRREIKKKNLYAYSSFCLRIETEASIPTISEATVGFVTPSAERFSVTFGEFNSS